VSFEEFFVLRLLRRQNRDIAIDFPHEGSAQVSGDAFGSKTQFGFLGDEPMTNGTLW